ncbi:hypothetical protein IWW50_002363 [Coemansia erecta]|nr:hypothetical protein IWW50_002363 [Coemansia erecta]
MRSVIGALLGMMVLASTCMGGGCENPASFKKCLAQTRAEVNICGLNMTCKCLRQENVVRCYEKCGDDSYYRRLKLGEKGQQQIFCSQKQPGESEDMPIIGGEDGPAEPKAADKKAAKAKAPPPKEAAPAPAPKAVAPVPQPDAGARRRAGTDNAASMTGAPLGNGMDIDHAASGASVNAHLIAAIVLASLYAH